MGYTNAGAADAPGLFRVHGDTVEVFPAQEKAPVRIEFFGDEIDRIRRMVSSTGQTIGNEDSIEIFPCRELALTDEAVHNMHVALYRASQDDSKLAALLEMVDARIVTPELDRFLPVMYGQTVSPLSHVSGKALVVLSEPRSLFDDCLRAYEDIEARAGEAGIAPAFSGAHRKDCSGRPVRACPAARLWFPATPELREPDPCRRCGDGRAQD